MSGRTAETSRGTQTVEGGVTDGFDVFRVVNADGDRQLTRRERDIVDLVVRALPNREIARRLGVSEHTVKVQLGRLFAKLGVKRRLQLAMRVLRR